MCRHPSLLNVFEAGVGVVAGQIMDRACTNLTNIKSFAATNIPAKSLLFMMLPFYRGFFPIADEAGDFYECDVNVICGKLVRQKDPQVRQRLASNSGTPREFIEELIDDEDMDVARAARKTLNKLDDEDEDDD